MADSQIKISALPAASTAADADILAGVQSGETKKFPLSVLATYMEGAITPADIGAVPTTRTVNSKPLTSDINLTASDVGAATTGDIPSASTAVPEMDGTASAGSSAAWARGDHVHPHDTSKADQIALDEVKSTIADAPETMTAANALQLNSSVGVTDKVPYLFRALPDGAGTREQPVIVGGSIAWNQMVDISGWNNFTTNGVSFTVGSNGKITATRTETGSSAANYNHAVSLESGHKYLLRGCPAGGGNSNYRLHIYNNNNSTYPGIDTGNGVLFAAPASQNFTLTCQVSAVYNANNLVFVPQLLDVTRCLGRAVADYLYALESGTAGAGVAWFRKLFPKDYYAYNAGTLLHVNASAHQMTGFNQWDEVWEYGGIGTSGGNYDSTAVIRSKNYCPILPNTEYYAKVGKTSGGGNQYIGIYFYATDKSYIGYIGGDGQWLRNTSFTTPTNAAFFKIRTVNEDSAYDQSVTQICINLHWDGERDGEYEPYTLHSYPLDSDLTLRGVPKLDADNNLYYDGDTYESDGTVTRRYAIVDLGSLTWNYGTYSSSNAFSTSDSGLPSLPKYASSVTTPANIICAKYDTLAWVTLIGGINGICAMASGSTTIRIYDSTFMDDALYPTSAEKTAALKAALNGVYLVYEVLTPTTESAEPFQSPQVVNDFGTERFVVTAQSGVEVPVGHDTFYPVDMAQRLELLPSMIASVELTHTASRNYAQGSFLIVQNTLYKVTSAIASGGAITPGTNVTATTVMAEIMAINA